MYLLPLLAWMLFPWKCCRWNGLLGLGGKENIYRNLWRRQIRRLLLYTHTDMALFNKKKELRTVVNGYFAEVKKPFRWEN